MSITGAWARGPYYAPVSGWARTAIRNDRYLPHAVRVNGGRPAEGRPGRGSGPGRRL